MFKRSGKYEHRPFVTYNVGNDRFTDGDCTGLVEDDRLNVISRLKHLAALDKNTDFCAAASTHHECGWRSKAKCTGTGDDNDSDREQHSCYDISAKEHVPDDKGEDRGDEHRRHEDVRDLINCFLNWCATGLCSLHQINNLCEQCIATNLRGLKHEGA